MGGKEHAPNRGRHREREERELTRFDHPGPVLFAGRPKKKTPSFGAVGLAKWPPYGAGSKNLNKFESTSSRYLCRRYGPRPRRPLGPYAEFAFRSTICIQASANNCI